MFDHNWTEHVMDLTHIMGNILHLVITSEKVIPSAGMNIIDLFVTLSVQHFSSDHYMVSFSVHSCKTRTHNLNQGMYLTLLNLNLMVTHNNFIIVGDF